MNSASAKPTVDFHKAPAACLLAAQSYLKRGWSPLALCSADHAGVDAAHQRTCTTPGAAPLWPWIEYQQRLPSERVLAIYWNRNPLANVGIALGPVSGLIALVFEGPAGEALRRRLGEALPETLEVTGPDGGRRLLYALPEQVALPGGSLRLPDTEEEIPCLSTGSYVVLPPSRHARGSEHTWRLGRGPHERNAATAPQWLVDYLLAEDKSTLRAPWSVADPQEQAATSIPLQNVSTAPADATLPDSEVSSPPPEPIVQHELAAAAEHALRTLDHGPIPHVIFLDQVQSYPARWLWPGWIPLGKLTVLDGDPGLGKSTLLLDLAARVTRGLALPDGAAGPSGGVTLLTAEDSLADTVRPRLEAAGADLARVRAFSAVGEPDGGNRPPVIPRDLDVLHRVLIESDSRLLIIDPFLAYLGSGIDSCNDQDIRRCLHRLAELAEITRCAIVLLRHLNKLSGGKALYRGAGSIGIIGAARSGLLVARDPDSEDHRILACTKSNLTAMPAALRFMLEPAGQGVCRVAWRGASPYQADELISQAGPVEERIIVHDAAHFLRTLLADGPVAADECLRQARAASISEKTLRRAKSRLKIQSIRDGEGLLGHWLWQLPKS